MKAKTKEPSSPADRGLTHRFAAAGAFCCCHLCRPWQAEHVGQNVTQKLIERHLVEGQMTPGEEIGLRVDQTLTQDATGTLVMLELEAMGLDRVRSLLDELFIYELVDLADIAGGQGGANVTEIAFQLLGDFDRLLSPKREFSSEMSLPPGTMTVSAFSRAGTSGASSYSSRISPTISSSRSSIVTRPAVPPYSSSTTAMCSFNRLKSASTSSTSRDPGTT